MKGEKCKEILRPKNQKVDLKNLERYIKIEKKNCNFMLKSNQKSDGWLSR